MAKVKILLLCVIISSTLILSSCFPDDILWRWEIPDPCELHGMENYGTTLVDVVNLRHFPYDVPEELKGVLLDYRFVKYYKYTDSFYHFVGRDYHGLSYNYQSSVCELRFDDTVYSEAKQCIFKAWEDGYSSHYSKDSPYTYEGFSLYVYPIRTYNSPDYYFVSITGFDDENKVLVSLVTSVYDSYYEKIDEEFIDWDNGHLTADTLEDFLDYHFGEYYNFGETIHD